jgi:hypothetical protein
MQIGLLAALPWLYSPHWYRSPTWVPAFYVLYLFVIAGSAAAVVVHELGHLVVALAVRAKIRSFRLGREGYTLINLQFGGFRLEVGWPGHGGAVHYIAMPSVWRRTVITLGGPLANLAVAGVVLEARLPVRHPITEVLALTIAVMGLVNLMPYRTRSGALSDGARLFTHAAGVRSQVTFDDVAELTSGHSDFDAGRLARVTAAQRKGDEIAMENIGQVASKLRQEGRSAELLELHAKLKLSVGMSRAETAAITSVELSVSWLPELPPDAANLAERRIDQLLRYHDLAPTVEPLASFALAMLRLRRRQHADVERLCRPALAMKNLPPASREGAYAMVILARQALGQPYADVLAKAAELNRDIDLALAQLQRILDPEAGKRLLADIKEFAANPRGPVQPDRTARVLAAYRSGDPVATTIAGYLGAMLRREGRTADLLEVHAGIAMPSGSRANLLTQAMHDLEYCVLLVPGLSADVYDLAASRVEWVLDNFAFGEEEKGPLFRAAARHTLALARLRQGHPEEVAELCADGLANAGVSVASRADYLATIALARHALGEPYENVLAQAVSLDPDGDLVKEASRLAIG